MKDHDPNRRRFLGGGHEVHERIAKPLGLKFKLSIFANEMLLNQISLPARNNYPFITLTHIGSHCRVVEILHRIWIWIGGLIRQIQHGLEEKTSSSCV